MKKEEFKILANNIIDKKELNGKVEDNNEHVLVTLNGPRELTLELDVTEQEMEMLNSEVDVRKLLYKKVDEFDLKKYFKSLRKTLFNQAYQPDVRKYKKACSDDITFLIIKLMR